jgi:hypothetical protein
MDAPIREAGLIDRFIDNILPILREDRLRNAMFLSRSQKIVGDFLAA